ncbi:MAG: PIG-L family deacetylase, partial [Chloroflexi bacterium]|nr:PIG-L family deacetylase [Chloroflexota bacterium]
MLAERVAPPDWLAQFCTGLPFAPRTLVVVAHPDDEVIGAGSRLPYLQDVHLLHVTDGAPRNMRDAAAHGFANCADYARARRDELVCALAQVSIGMERAHELGVPDQEASQHLVELTKRVRDAIMKLQPALIVTLPYEGGHPDHDAAAFAVHNACALLAVAPLLLEMSSYHNCGGAMSTFEFLPREGCDEITLTLSPDMCAQKRRMIECFTTQQGVLQ